MAKRYPNMQLQLVEGMSGHLSEQLIVGGGSHDFHPDPSDCRTQYLIPVMSSCVMPGTTANDSTGSGNYQIFLSAEEFEVVPVVHIRSRAERRRQLCAIKLVGCYARFAPSAQLMINFMRSVRADSTVKAGRLLPRMRFQIITRSSARGTRAVRAVIGTRSSMAAYLPATNSNWYFEEASHS